MHDAVQDGVGQGWLVQPGVPGRHRQLTCDQRGMTAYPVIEQLEQVTALVRGNGADGEVVQDQQVQLSLVERYVRDVEPGGSNPLTTTIRSNVEPADLSGSVGFVVCGCRRRLPRG